jgi:predicted metal-binding membrane protein
MVATYRGRTAGLGATPAFAAGYLIAWLVAGLLGYVLVEGVRSLDLGFLARDEAGRYQAGSVILGGALYQRTRPKDACLRRCRDARGGSLPSTGARAARAPCAWGRSAAGSASPAAGGSWRPSSPAGS